MTYRNIVTETDRMFARLYNKNAISKKAHSLMQQCKKDKADYEKAERELSEAKRMRYTPAGWYEEHIAKLKLNNIETRLYSNYTQLRNELRKSNASFQ